VKSEQHAVLIRCIVVYLAYFISPTFGTPLHGDILGINSEPGQPYVETISGKEGEEVELQCQSQGGRPPAEIMWWDGEGRRIAVDVTEHVNKMEDTNTFKTVSTVKIKASKYPLIKCSAHNEVFPAGRMSDTIQIGTKHQPEVEIKELQDGDSVKITCQRKNNDRFLTFKWFINDVEIFNENQNILELQKFSKSFDNSHIKCFAEDVTGELNLVKDVRLMHKDKHPMSNLVENSIFPRSKKKGRKIKKRTMLLCETEDDSTEEPSNIYIAESSKNLRSSDLIIATDNKNKYKCKIIIKGIDIINKMSKDFTSITKSMNQMSKTLDEFNTSIDEEEEVFTEGYVNIPY